MSTHLKIVLAEPSTIIRNGLEVLLKQLPGFRIQLIESTSADSIPENLHIHRPDILIINPMIPGYLSIAHLKEESNNSSMKYVALVYTPIDQELLRQFDDQINIYDSSDEICHKLERMTAEESSEETKCDDEQQNLSTREKEIVVCVVKGMTNREIADRLFLSTHTVITHRRNIARKLQIHSVSGLTIYAIVNKLVELSDIHL